MVSNNIDNYMYFLFECQSSIYVKNLALLDVIKKYKCLEINTNESLNEINDFLEKENDNKKRIFIVINIDNIDNDNQKILSYMVKDRSYQTSKIHDNCKIIVVGDIEKLDKNLKSQLVLFDV